MPTALGFSVLVFAGAVPVAARAVAVRVADDRLSIGAVADLLTHFFADFARAALIFLELLRVFAGVSHAPQRCMADAGHTLRRARSRMRTTVYC